MIINFYAARNKTECKASYERERRKERGKLNKKVSQTPTHALTEMRWQYRLADRQRDIAKECERDARKVN